MATGTNCEACRRGIPTEQPAFLLDGQVICRECHDERYPVCPSCREMMQRKLPKNHGKCPNCNERFFVRREQWYFDTTLLTAKQKDDATSIRDLVDSITSLSDTLGEEARQAVACFHRAGERVSELIRMLETSWQKALDARDEEPWISTPDEALPHIRELFGFGAHEKPPTAADLHEAMLRASSPPRRCETASDAVVAAAAYCERTRQGASARAELQWKLGLFMHQAGLTGWRPVLLAANRNRLKDQVDRLRDLDCRMWVEVMADPRCEVARRLEGRRFDLESAIAKPPVPAADCPCDWCACSIDVQVE